MVPEHLLINVAVATLQTHLTRYPSSGLVMGLAITEGCIKFEVMARSLLPQTHSRWKMLLRYNIQN